MLAFARFRALSDILYSVSRLGQLNSFHKTALCWLFSMFCGYNLEFSISLITGKTHCMIVALKVLKFSEKAELWL